MGINIDSVYAGNTINAEWIKAEHGGAWVVKISDCSVKQFGGDGEEIERKVLVHFHGTDKCLALNVTNKNLLKELFGPDTDAWIGKEIQLVTERVPFGNKIVDAVRVNLRHNPAAAPTTAPAASGKVLGPAGSAKLLDRLNGVEMTLNDLRHYLAGKNLGAAVDQAPATWPVAWGMHIAAWMEKPVRAPEGGYSALTDEDIPFAPLHGI